MRILFVTPYPPSRIRVRSYSFLKHLRQEHEVTIVTLCSSTREELNAKSLRLQGYNVVSVQEKRWQRLLRCGIALFSQLPLQVAYANSKLLMHMVQQLCAENQYDIIHVEHLRGMASLQSLPLTHPIIWDAVDCISLLFKQSMEAGASRSVRTLAALDYKRTQRFEANLLKRLQHVVITSERDRQALIEISDSQENDQEKDKQERRTPIDIIPNGVDLDYFCPGQHERYRCDLVFSGKMSYHANVAAVLYLYKQIMPLIWKYRPGTRLTIVGSSPPKSIRRLAIDSRVEVTGYVDDMRPYIGGGQVVIAPMIYSVGIQNKVLEAMAMGTPVIASTPVAAALHARPERDLLVANSPQEFANAALFLLDNSDARTVLSRNGRDYVEQYHDWSMMAQKLISVYEQAIAIDRGADSSLVPAIYRTQ